jgi:hypothetical protein
MSEINAADASSPCHDEMMKILQRQQCFQLQESSKSTNIQSSCSFSGNEMLQHMPFHNYAAYAGQGFGRIVEHTVLGCMFASVILERPCTIDLDVRDPYWTWRSFLNHGSFDWEWSKLHKNAGAQLRYEIEQAIANLSSTADDQWDAKYFDDGIGDRTDRSLVLPMIWNEGWDVDQHLDYWAHATISSSNSNTNQKVLLSPNWGNSWNQHVPVAALIAKKTNGQCKLNQLRTQLQNEMFAPTSLSRLLHQQRTDRVFQPLMLQGEKNDRPLVDQPPSIPSFVYGAIHLRTILSDANIRRSYLTSEWVQALGQCLDNALMTHQSTSSKISHWWLIADNRTVAKYVLQRLPEYHPNVPVIVDLDPHFWEKEGTHSGYAMKQKYFHSKMETSMMDFMVLHEAKVAVASHGSFGTTGARGNGKVKLQACAPQKAFSIFAAPSNSKKMRENP